MGFDTYSSIKTVGGLIPMGFVQRFATLDPRVSHLDQYEHLDNLHAIASRLSLYSQAFQDHLVQSSEKQGTIQKIWDLWLKHLFKELGYFDSSASHTLRKKRCKKIDAKIAAHYQYNHIPIQLYAHHQDLDSVIASHQNTQKNPLWSMICNGSHLRLIRREHMPHSLAYIEFDLQTMFRENIQEDFRVFYLLCHRISMSDANTEIQLEQWFTQAQFDRTHTLSLFKTNISQAITVLGTGFLKHSSNQELHKALQLGHLKPSDFYQELIYLIYRIIFIFIAESRNVLLTKTATQKQITEYKRHYSLHRFQKQISQKVNDKNHDVWQECLRTIKYISQGNRDLALPKIDSFLWQDQRCHWVQSCLCHHRNFIHAIKSLCMIFKGTKKQFIDWRDITAESLGSTYESLLDLTPIIDLDKRTIKLKMVTKSRRKKTGSYYTPTSIIECLLDASLDPMIQEKLNQIYEKDPLKNRAKRVEILEQIKICDPACGSGYFLVACAHRLAKILAQTRTNHVTPHLDDLNQALKDVILQCIYGVDLNPMAVELCKISLWLEIKESSESLSIFNQTIQCGNSLVGTSKGLMKKGIPNEAFTQLTTDDVHTDSSSKKKIYLSKILQAKNKRERQTVELMSPSLISPCTDQNLMADLWCSAFVWPKLKDTTVHPDLYTSYQSIKYAPTTHVWEHFKMKNQLPSYTQRVVQNLTETYQFFHWDQAFPNVFHPKSSKEMVGFDLVIGNPPYISNYSKHSIQSTYLSHAEHLMKAYLTHDTDLSLPGRLNLYLLFLVLATKLMKPQGRFAFVLPDTLLNNDSYQVTRQGLLDLGHLESVWLFKQPVFKDATVGTALVIWRKGSSKLKQVIFHEVQSHTIHRLEEIHTQECSIDYIKNLSDMSWHPSALKRRHFMVAMVELQSFAMVKDGINPGKREMRKRLIHMTHTEVYDQKLLEGSCITPFVFEWRHKWIRYNPQMVSKHDKKTGTSLRKKWIFTSPKIIYRQTASRPICAVDEDSYYTLNSVHNIILKENNRTILWALCAYLNSDTCAEIYIALTGESRKTFPQVHVKSMKKLLVPQVLLDDQHQTTIQLAQIAQQLSKSTLTQTKYLQLLELSQQYVQDLFA